MGFLIKPVDDWGLHTTIETALARHQAEQRIGEVNCACNGLSRQGRLDYGIGI